MDKELFVETITRSIIGHSFWKAHFQSIIENGTNEFTPEAIEKDDFCNLGKWLNGGIDEEAKSDEEYFQVKEAHKKFHACAGDVLRMALSGDKEGAKKRISVGGDYAGLSSELHQLLMKWRAKYKTPAPK
jgi:hypothetical protein